MSNQNVLKPIITGIDISNSNLEKTTIIQKDDLVELYDDIGLLPNCHEDLKKHFIEMIREKYSELICRIVEQKDFTPTTKKIYLQLLPYISDANLMPLVSEEFDNNILPNGWIKGQLYTISGPSGGGKTALGIMFSSVLMLGVNPQHKDHIEQKQVHVLYINLEQAQEEVEKRFVSCFSALNDLDRAIAYSDIMNPSEIKNLADYNFASHLYSFYSSNLTILNPNDFCSLDIIDIEGKVKDICQKEHIDFVVIDQYQNISGSEEISEHIATELRNMARNLDLPVLVLGQMNKLSQQDSMNENGQMDINKISAISLKGASALAQQSTNVTFIIPTGKTKIINGHQGEIILIANKKGRYGCGEGVKMLFLKQFNLLLDLEAVKETSNKKNGGFVDDNI